MRTIEVFLDIERDGKTVELLVMGECYGPDYECGIMASGVEGISAEELGTHREVELTESEMERAIEKINQKFNDDAVEDYEGRE